MAGYFEPVPLADDRVAGMRGDQERSWDQALRTVDNIRHVLRAQQKHATSPWPPSDPREILYRDASEAGLLSPVPTAGPSRYQHHLGAVASAPFDAMGYVFGAPARLRDGLVLAGQDLNSKMIWDEAEMAWRPLDPAVDRPPRAADVKPDPDAYVNAASSLGRGLAGVVFPSMNEGGVDGPRDWRKFGVAKLGLDPMTVLGADMLTDVANYAPLPLGRGAKMLHGAMRGASKPAELIDKSGDVIRVLKSTPAVRVTRPVPRLP